MAYQIVWDPARRSPYNTGQVAQSQTQMPQQNPLGPVMDAALPILVERLAEAGLASSASGAIAPVATNMLSSTPSMMLPGASSAAATSGASAGSGAMAGAAPFLSTAAVVAMPFILNKIFGGKGIQRPWSAQEVAQDMPGKRNVLSEQISGYGALGQDARASLLTKLHDANLLALPGRGKVENGKLVTAERSPEFVNWARYMNPNSARLTGEVDRNSKWYDGKSSAVPTEDEIKNAHWLTGGKRNELLQALSAITGAKSSSSENNNPLLRRV